MSTRSARAKRSAMRSTTAKASRSAPLNDRLPRRAYLASSAAPSNSGMVSRHKSIRSISQDGRASRNRARNASAPAADAEPARGEQRKWKSLGTYADIPGSASGSTVFTTKDTKDARSALADRVLRANFVPLVVKIRLAP